MQHGAVVFELKIFPRERGESQRKVALFRYQVIRFATEKECFVFAVDSIFGQ